MPVLPVCDADGNLRVHDEHRIISAMLWPHDPEIRERYEARQIAASAGRVADRSGATLRIDPKVVPMVLQAPIGPFEAGGDVKPLQRAAWAGEQLLWIVSLANVGLRHSHAAVIYIMEKQREREGVRRKGSKTAFYDSWKDYRSVAHLWAAWLCVRDTIPPGIAASVWFAGMLMNAKRILVWKHENFDAADNDWTIPAHWRDPEWSPHWPRWAMNIVIEEWVRAALANYPNEDTRPQSAASRLSK